MLYRPWRSLCSMGRDARELQNMLGVVDLRDLTLVVRVVVSLSPLWVAMSFIPGAIVVAGASIVAGASVVAGDKVVGAKR